MPKIVINEFDKSTAGSSSYANFSVVVPGFLGAAGEANIASSASVFDENGVYECSSQEDFVNNVGCVSTELDVDKYVASPEAPTITRFIAYRTAAVDAEGKPTETFTDADEPKVFKLKDLTQIPAEDLALIPEDVDFAETAELHVYHNEQAFYLALDIYNKHVSASKTDTNTYLEDVNFKLYACNKTNNGRVGYLLDTKCTYELAEGTPLKAAAMPNYQAGRHEKEGGILEFNPLYSYSTEVAYAAIKEEDVGRNGYFVRDHIIHYGNQIAYELLGLGYTVLYKVMSKDAYMTDGIESDYDEDEVVTNDDILEYIEAVLRNPNNTGYYLENGSIVIPYGDVESVYMQEFDVEVDINKDGDTDDEGEKYTEEREVDRKRLKSTVEQLNEIGFWSPLKDKSTYDFRYVVTGLLDANENANVQIMNLATHIRNAEDSGRGDCIALIDIDRACYTGAKKNTQAKAIPYIAYEAAKYASTYAAIFAPYVTYTMAEMEEYGFNRTFPGSFHYLACAAKAAENYSEWYANAGYTRGVCKYNIESVGIKLGEVAIQALEPRYKVSIKTGTVPMKDAEGNITDEFPVVSSALNLIVKIKNSYYLWGNRTSHALGTKDAADGNLVASHFLNIRQLCTTIKKQVYVACRRLTFDPNSDILWLNFTGLIEPTLKKMKGDQGIRDYKIIQGVAKEKGTLKAMIRIVPIEAVEDFIINLYLEDNLDGTIVDIDE